jgi:hypothetical protein
MNQPDPRKHRLISFVKSGIRIGASGMVAFLALTHPYSMAAFLALTHPALTPALILVGLLAIGYGVAEVVGVLEELV